MAGCSAHNVGGNNDASMDRIVGYTLGAAGAGAIVGLIFALLNGAGGPLAALIAALGAVAGASLGFFIGSAVDWFNRLKEQNPRTITIAGNVRCVGRNPFGFQPFSDGDWTCNIEMLALAAPTSLPITPPRISEVDEIRLRAAPGSGLAQAFPSFNTEEHTVPILHCELSALAGTLSVTGGAIGSAVGFGLGIAAGIGACIAAGIFTFGIGAALCALIIAALAALGAFAGGAVGSLVGAFIGWLIDEIGDFDRLGETIEADSNCRLFITGRWVTDISHEHNEIHDIESVSVVCPRIDLPKQPLPMNTVAAAAIGRQPTGGGNGLR